MGGVLGEMSVLPWVMKLVPLRVIASGLPWAMTLWCGRVGWAITLVTLWMTALVVPWVPQWVMTLV
jgi:hypothetical protein